MGVVTRGRAREGLRRDDLPAARPWRGATTLLAALAACSGPRAADTGTAPSTAPDAILEADDVAFVGVSATFSAPGDAAWTYRWDFGDGGSAEGATVSHAYAEPGRHVVRLTVTSADGRTDSNSATVTSVHPPLATAPTSSGALALLDGALYAALPDVDGVAVVRDGAVRTRFATCVGPTAVSAAHGLLAVVCPDADRVQLWDTEAGALAADVTLRWGARPVAVAIHPTDDAAVVALRGTGELARVALDGTVTTVASVEDPGGLTLDGEEIWVARFRSPSDGGQLVRIGSDGTFDVALAPDEGPDSDTDARGVPTLLGAAAVRPDGRAIVVGGLKSNVARGLYRDGQPLTFETTARAALRSHDVATGAQERAIFDNRDRVGALAFTPLGDRLLVAQLGAGVVDVLDPFTLTRLGGFQDVGTGLDGIATDGDRAYVLASRDHALVAYDLGAGNDQVEVWRAELLDDDDRARLDPALLSGARLFVAAGDRRMSRDAYLSCASCHPDGADDGLTWDFTDRGEGLRDTQALFALPVGGPFHWSANFDELQDFEGPIRATQGGTGFLTDEAFDATADPLGAPKAGASADLDALAAWVAARSEHVPRSPWREPDGAWTAAAERGRAIFLAQGCDGCHAGDALTDAGWSADGSPVLHDVGTLLPSSGARAGGALDGLRTPSLRGLFATGPYLHDGRAATIEEALAAHGVALSEAEVGELARYLREIEDAP